MAGKKQIPSHNGINSLSSLKLICGLKRTGYKLKDFQSSLAPPWQWFEGSSEPFLRTDTNQISSRDTSQRQRLGGTQYFLVLKEEWHKEPHFTGIIKGPRKGKWRAFNYMIIRFCLKRLRGTSYLGQSCPTTLGGQTGKQTLRPHLGASGLAATFQVPHLSEAGFFKTKQNPEGQWVCLPC